MELTVCLAQRAMPILAVVMDRLDTVTYLVIVCIHCIELLYSVRMELMEMVHVCVMILLLGTSVNYVLRVTNLEPTVLKVDNNCV